MKALIATTEVFNLSWVSSWVKNETSQKWQPIYSEILDCQRVAQVEPDDKTFPTYHTLIWVDCPDNCVADEWYFKDSVCYPKPQDQPMPITTPSVEVLP
jgi:hypothetical protein